MTDEYETKLLAEDNTMALHIQEKCKFETLIAAVVIATRNSSSEEARQAYAGVIAHLSDAQSDIDYLVRITSEAGRAFPSSRDLGEVCSKKKMGAAG